MEICVLVAYSTEKAMAPHSITLAWKIPWTEEPGRLQYMGSRRLVHDWVTSFHFSCIGEGNGNPLQCSCLENPRDGGAWWAAISGVAQSQTRLKWLSSSRKSSVFLKTLEYLACFQKAIIQSWNSFSFKHSFVHFLATPSPTSACVHVHGDTHTHTQTHTFLNLFLELWTW